MTCRRNCVHGFLGTREVYWGEDEDGTPLEPSEGRILQHLEHRQLMGEPSKIRTCPCQNEQEPA